MSIIVHHLEKSRSTRVLWLLEELELPYEVRRYERDQATLRAPAELKRVHPLGKSPIIEDGSTVIAETGAILEYLVEKANGRLGAPAERENALRYRHFLHFAEGSLMPVLFTHLVLGKVPLLGKAAQRKFSPMVALQIDYVESELASRDWFAGDGLTAADVMMSYPLEAAVARVESAARLPNIAAWLERIRARAPYQAALAAGGPVVL